MRCLGRHGSQLQVPPLPKCISKNPRGAVLGDSVGLETNDVGMPAVLCTGVLQSAHIIPNHCLRITSGRYTVLITLLTGSV